MLKQRARYVTIFFIIPPLGIYGMSKRNTVAWKKVLYILPASFFMFLLFIGIVGAFLVDNKTNKLDSNIDIVDIIPIYILSKKLAYL